MIHNQNVFKLKCYAYFIHSVYTIKAEQYPLFLNPHIHPQGVPIHEHILCGYFHRSAFFSALDKQSSRSINLDENTDTN